MGDLCVADETGLRSVVRVGVGTGEAESGVPRIGDGDISDGEGGDLGLGGQASSLCISSGATDVGQLITDAVGDDVWVQGLLLSLVDNWVDGLEGEFSDLAAIEPGLEFHCWHTGSKVEAKGGLGCGS
jgi:hypothetical protein